MNRNLRWYELFWINSYWFGTNVVTAVVTPLLLPYLVLLFMPPTEKNTHLAAVRVIGLTVAMFTQPLAGMLSDRSNSRFGKRRPFIALSACLSVVFLVLIGCSTLFQNFGAVWGWPISFGILLIGIILLQISSNIGIGALQGLIPDVVPEQQRGKASGVKSVFELFPIVLIIFIGPLIDSGEIGRVIGIVAATLLTTMVITILSVKEEALQSLQKNSLFESFIRLFGLTAIFLTVTQSAIAGVRFAADWTVNQSFNIVLKVALVGFSGFVGMIGAIFVGVYFGAWIGIGKSASRHRNFILWVLNRLLFLAAVGSIQGFAQFYLRDVLHLANPVTMTTILLAVVAGFLLPSAIIGGYFADKIGKKRMIGFAGLIASAGTILLLFSNGFPMVILSGCVIGLATGVFMPTSWALGTELAPREESGRYLGISNLAGAGAGIVGAGIGGPLADFFNILQPGLGYLILFAIYAGLFLLSILAILNVTSRNTLAV